ncbi:hypothetical protein FB451DRAFT_1434388 [Mycena latifolia]|nr:hypothetical protein FB451DRAFT_1434388 [Mycena latifolia]
MAPSITTLADDVLLYILALCDISSVLAISQTCKSLQLLSGDRHLWTALLETLTLRRFRDPPPGEDLRALQTPALRKLAQRAARAPEMWLDAAPVCPPALARTLHVPCAVFQRANFFAGSAALLPGGRYIVATHRARVMLLDAENGGVLVGIHDAQGGAHIHQFRAEVARDGATVLVMLHTETFAAPRRKGLEIVRFSLEAQDCVEALLVLYADRNAFHGASAPQICGRYASIVIFAKPRWRILLVDWAAESYVLVDIPQRPRSALIPAHLILAMHASPLSMRVFVLGMESFGEHWQPIRDIDWTSAAPLSSLSPLYSETIPVNPKIFPESADFRLSAYESPLTLLKFDIHLHIWNAPDATRRPRTPLSRLLARTGADTALPPVMLLRFSLTLPSAFSHVVWTVCDPRVQRLPACFPDFDYAGSDMPLHGQVLGVPGTPRPQSISLSELVSRSHVRMSTHSGALTLVLPFEIVVRYYE